jgi:hypothetical protein
MQAKPERIHRLLQQKGRHIHTTGELPNWTPLYSNAGQAQTPVTFLPFQHEINGPARRPKRGVVQRSVGEDRRLARRH